MPIQTIGPESLLNALDEEPNPLQRWPNRQVQPNRIEPLAAPYFDTPFRLVPGEKIFTIGSCFARHVERKLADRGFELPVLRLLKEEVFAELGNRFLNNYGVPSIAQELAWALDPEHPYDPGIGIAELLPGLFVDVHLPVDIKPVPYDVIIKRREAIGAVMRELPDCRVIILTLGLAEVWYDKVGKVYLNTSPRQPLVLREPDRYELRVLSYDETIVQLRRVIDLIRRFGRADVQILLTVSPVPMTMTFRPMDVAVANSYSKSVLRCATEHAVFEFDNVHYFPSFESVLLSDRKRAWIDDMIHVTQELVDFNVDRMVRAYADEESLDECTPEQLLQLSEQRSEGDKRRRWLLLRDHVRHASNAAFARQYIDLALQRTDYAKAQEALDLAPFERADQKLEQAAIWIGQGKFAEAVKLLRTMRFYEMAPERLKAPGRRYWKLMIDGLVGIDDVEEAERAAGIWSRIPPKKGPSHLIYAALARGWRRKNEMKKAVHFFELATSQRASEMLLLEYVEALMLDNRRADARNVLDKVVCTTRTAYRRHEELRSFLPGG